MIIPNEINDMHSSSVAAGDAFLEQFVPQILDSPAFADSVLFITWTKATPTTRRRPHRTIIASPNMPPRIPLRRARHNSLLDAAHDRAGLGMPFLGAAATATTIKLQY